MHTYVLQQLVSSRQADLQRDRQSSGHSHVGLLQRLRSAR